MRAGGDRRLRPARASTRSTSPTRARSSPSSPPTRPTPRWPRCAAHPLGADAAGIGEIAAEPRGHRRAAHVLRRHPDRRHARRRPAAPDLLRPMTARTPAPRHRHRAGRRVPALRLPPRRRARAGRLASATTAPACSSTSRVTPDADRRARAACSSTSRRRWPASSSVTQRSDAPTGRRATASGSSRATTPARADGAGQRRHRHLRRLPGRGRRPGRPALPLPVHELHELRAALHDRRCASRTTDRPRRWPAFTMCAGVPGRVRRSRRPPVPRPAQRLPRLRAAAGLARPPTGARSHAAIGGARPQPSTRCAAARSSRSRASAATTSRSTPPTPTAVAELRRRKARDDKPFAVMVPDLAEAPVALCVLDGARRRCARRRRAGRSCSRRGARAPASPTGWRPASPTSGCSCRTARSTTSCCRASAARS